MSKQDYEIPIEQIDSGLDRCAANVRRLMDDYHALMKNGSQSHAAAMSVFALEELVKYHVLKEERKSALAAGKPKVHVDERIFGKGRKPHQHKLALARQEQLIPDDAWVIHEGYFDSAYFSSRFFDTETVISATLRTESIFVDWDRENSCWVNPPSADIEKLEHFSESVLRALSRIQSDA
jgi:AbiV family abortive infection protein